MNVMRGCGCNSERDKTREKDVWTDGCEKVREEKRVEESKSVGESDNRDKREIKNGVCVCVCV